MVVSRLARYRDSALRLIVPVSGVGGAGLVRRALGGSVMASGGGTIPLVW